MKTKTILITLLSLVTISTLTACNSGSQAQQSSTEEISAKRMIAGDVSFESKVFIYNNESKNFDKMTYTLTNIAFNLANEKIKINSAKVNFETKKAREEDIQISTKLMNPNANQLLSMTRTFKNDTALAEMDLLIQNSSEYASRDKSVTVLSAHEFSYDILNRDDLSLNTTVNQKLINYLKNNIKPSNKTSYYYIPLKRDSHWVTVVVKVENHNAEFYFIDSTAPKALDYNGFVDEYASIAHIFLSSLFNAFDDVNGINKNDYNNSEEEVAFILDSTINLDYQNKTEAEQKEIYAEIKNSLKPIITGLMTDGNDKHFYPGWFLQYGNMGCGITSSILINQLMKNPNGYENYVLNKEEIEDVAKSTDNIFNLLKYKGTYKFHYNSIFDETARRIQAAYIIERLEK